MNENTPRALIEVAYADAAQKYLRSLPPEHFMEATAQGTQREITVESLALVKARRPEVQYFNDLLVQYPRRGKRRPGQVVPDNMVVIHPTPIEAERSYNIPLQPVGPFWVLEYVSKHNKRKDYEDNFDRYEKELQVPYYLLFHPDDQELTLYRHKGKRYTTVRPNEQARYPISELELEVALLGQWVRFWFRGELLPLPGELQQRLDAERDRVKQLEELLEQEKQARLALEQEVQRLRAQQGSPPGSPAAPQ